MAMLEFVDQTREGELEARGEGSMLENLEFTPPRKPYHIFCIVHGRKETQVRTYWAIPALLS
jgi:hypothetical protein